MPKISRFFIKTGLLYFLLALALRLVLDVTGWVPKYIIRPLFWHALMLGWITQIIMGVSTWMFPGRTKEESFSAQKWSWLAYVGLNAGLILRFISAPLVVTSGNYIWRLVLSASAILLLLGIVFFVIELWPRIMSKKQRIKRRKKKRGKK